MNKARFSELSSNEDTIHLPFPIGLVFGGREWRSPLPDLDLRPYIAAALVMFFPQSHDGLLRMMRAGRGGVRRRSLVIILGAD
jgi:hypothetical protein